MSEICIRAVMTVGDAAAVVTATAAALGLFLAYRQLHHHSRLKDFDTLLSLQRELSKHWESYRRSKPEHEQYYFGELMSFYEIACYLFNRRIVAKCVEDYFRDHVIEVFIQLLRAPEHASTIETIRSGRNTYKEIAAFLRRHKKAYLEHWAFLVKSGLVTN